MRAALVVLVSIVAVTPLFGRCPGHGRIDFNQASPKVLAAHGVPVALASELRLPFKGYSDLLQFAADNHFQLAPEFAICPVILEVEHHGGKHHGRPTLILAGDDDIAAVNVNSSSVDDLDTLRTCGKSPAELKRLATTNQNKSFATPAEFSKWLGANQTCPDLTFKLRSRGEIFTLRRATAGSTAH